MTFRSIHWDDKDAKLKGFSAAAKSGAASIVKIEIEVVDPFRLALILQELAEIKRDQSAKPKAAEDDAPKRTTRKVTHKPPLMLPFYPDTRGRP